MFQDGDCENYRGNQQQQHLTDVTQKRLSSQSSHQNICKENNEQNDRQIHPFSHSELPQNYGFSKRYVNAYTANQLTEYKF